jgi:hypothetical protein
MKLRNGPISDRPMEFLIGLLCAQGGITMALLNLSPPSIQNFMPIWMVNLWGATLTLGGVLVLIGILMRYRNDKFVLGLLTERSGYWPLMCGSSIFAIAIIFQAGLRGLFPALTYVTFAGFCTIRHTQISGLVKRLTKLATEDE